MSVLNSYMNMGLESDEPEGELQEMLYAKKAEVETAEDLKIQRGTPIPALFNQFFKFIANPSTVSVETFKRMVDTDDTVGSAADFIITCLSAKLGKYQHPVPEISEFVTKTLNNVRSGWQESVKEIFSAAWVGFSVSEKVWQNSNEGFILKDLVTLPPGTILFEVDRVGQLTDDGILQFQRNYNPFLGGPYNVFTNAIYGFDGELRPDPLARQGDLPFPIRTSNQINFLSLRIPKQKCIHYAFNAQGRFGSPYGRSLLRRAYKWWVLKDSVIQMMSIALDRKGTPLTIIFADPNTTLMDPSTYNPNLKPNQQRKMRADQAASEAFKNIHNDSVIVLPGKKGQIFDVDFMPQTPNTADFLSAIEMCNKAIMRALLVPELIYTTGDVGSYSLGQEHANSFDKVLDSIVEGMNMILLEQVVKEIIAYNFPEEMWKKEGLGTFVKRDLTTEERSKMMELFERAVNTGALDVNDLADLNLIRETVGAPRREELLQTSMEQSVEEGMPEDAESDLDPTDKPDTQQEKEQERIADENVALSKQKRSQAASRRHSKKSRLSQGEFVAVGVINGESLLIAQRAELGTWGVFYGPVEDAESPEQAAIRRIFTDANISKAEMKAIGQELGPQGEIIYQYSATLTPGIEANFDFSGKHNIEQKFSDFKWVNPHSPEFKQMGIERPWSNLIEKIFS